MGAGVRRRSGAGLSRPGQMKPEQLEIERLRREVAKLKAERDILKKAAPTSRGKRYEVRLRREAPGDLAGGMDVRCARRLPFGLPCLAESIAQREHRRSDEAVGAKVRASFLASDRTYGARRVWRDVLADGVACGLHRIERLMRAAGPAGAATAPASAEGRRRSPGRGCAAEPSRPPVCSRARRTRSGSPTSPTSGRPKAGSMSRPSSTCSRAGWSAGRSRGTFRNPQKSEARLPPIGASSKHRNSALMPLLRAGTGCEELASGTAATYRAW